MSTKKKKSALTAKQILERLDSAGWINRIASKEFPFIRKMATPPQWSIFKEVTVRIKTENKTKYGRPKPQRRRLDSVLLVKPHYKAYGNEIFTLGIEIKVSKSDLLSDEKFIEYLGYTDFLLFAVPENLVEYAVQKLKDFPTIGIISVGEKPVVSKYPDRQKVSPDHKSEVLQELLLKQLQEVAE